MLITMKGIIALQRLCQELQEDAGIEFPQSVLTQLLVLYDVCKSLELNIFQCRTVLGAKGWQYVHEYINTPLGVHSACHTKVHDLRQVCTDDTKN